MKARPIVSNQTDTRRKTAQVYAMLENPKFAAEAAKRIVEQPTLLAGLAKVVEKIGRHDEAADILAPVFTDEIAQRYPASYAAFLTARLFAQ